MKQYANTNENQQTVGAVHTHTHTHTHTRILYQWGICLFDREQHFYQYGICLLDRESRTFTNGKFVNVTPSHLTNGRTSMVSKTKIKKDIGIVELSSTTPISFCAYYGNGPPMDTG